MERWKCESCGHEFESEGPADAVACPECGSVVVVPASGETDPPEADPAGEENAAAESAAGGEAGDAEEPAEPAEPPESTGVQLSLKEEGFPGTPTRTCPNCGAVIPEDAVLCVNCGYDLRTGRPVAPRRSFAAAGIIAGVAAGLVVGGAVGFLLGRKSVSGAERTVSAERVSPVSRPAGTSYPEGAEETAAAAAGAEPAAATTGTATRAAGLAEEARAAQEGEEVGQRMSAAERDRLRERIRQRLEAWLAKRYPPFEKDGQADLRLKSGIVHRGRFLGVKQDVVVIVKAGKPMELPLADLDRPSRLRVDMSYRRKYLESAVRHYEQRLSKQSAASLRDQ